MNSFKCEVCGNKHNFHTLIESPKPEIIGRITSGELNKRLDVVAKSIFLVDRKKMILESEMSINITDLDDTLDFFIWIEVDGKTCYEVAKENDESGLVNIEGKLIGEIPLYSNETNG